MTNEIHNIEKWYFKQGTHTIFSEKEIQFLLAKNPELKIEDFVCVVRKDVYDGLIKIIENNNRLANGN